VYHVPFFCESWDVLKVLHIFSLKRSTAVNLSDVQYSSDTMSSASAPAVSSTRRKGRTVACSVLLLDDTVDVFHVPVS